MLVGVFERFTDRARRVLVLAQEEARLLSHNAIDTEHVLLGLLDEGEGVAAQALASLNIDPDAVRAKVEDNIGPAGSPTTGSPPFTPRTKKVLELSLREAQQLGHTYIGTEHLLLGLVREGEGFAAQILESLGADLPRVRQQVIDLLDAGTPSNIPKLLVTSGEERRGGPRCPACRSLLQGHVAYRVLPVTPIETGDKSATLDVAFVYCLHCGLVVAHTPMGDIGGHRLSGDRTVSASVGRPPAAQHADRLIAEGVRDGDVRWALRAGGDNGNYSTTLSIEDQSGVIAGGGMAGPKLWDEDLLNVYTGSDDDGPLAIVVRTDPSIVRTVLVTQAGEERDLTPCGNEPIDGLRFYIGFAWPAQTIQEERPRFALSEVRGLDAEGTIRETYDLNFWDTMPR